MTIYSTIVKAINPMTWEPATFSGPNIEAPSRDVAYQYCQKNELGYCFIGDPIIMEIPTKKDGTTPDWDNAVDYENLN